MRRTIAATAAALALTLAITGSLLAASSTINPASQSHNHNVASNWTLSWGSTAHYHVEFYYGDGWVTVWQDTALVGANRSHTFSPCSGDPTNYTQTLDVWDGWVNATGKFKGFALDTSTAHENAGLPC